MAEEPHRTSTLMGQIGLNNMPSARMDPAGTVRIGVSTLDPYVHSFAGVQVTDWLHMGIRQSAQKSSLLSNHDHLYPGVDLKLLLNKEGRYNPAIALGFLSGFGHRQTASEYIALSKRYNAFDFTLGMGWGRLAGDGHIRNPLRRLSSHFDKDRTFSSQITNSAKDWFKGEEVGFFGGIEYHTPLDGLSVKADWGANPAGVEAASLPGYDNPAKWSLAVTYAPVPWADALIGIQGTDKIMARLSLQNNVMDWLVRPYKKTSPPSLLPRGPGTDAKTLRDTARDHDIHIGHLRREGDTSMAAHIYLRPHLPLAQQIGRAGRHMAAHAPPEIEIFHITPLRGKLAGRPIRLLRRDLELAGPPQQITPEEMWHTAEIGMVVEEPAVKFPFLLDFNLSLQNDLGLTEEDSEYLYRSAAIARVRADLPGGYFGGLDLKINIKDNLDRLNNRKPNLDVIRGDVDAYTKRRLYLERAYGGWRREILPDLFVASTAGAIEEMYAGAGIEILYRPFGKTWAIGAESWNLYKRDPSDIWGMDTIGQARPTGHINAYYEIPDTNITAYTKIGRYLGGDLGGTIGINHSFDNGVTLNAYGTLSEESDYDNLGGTTNISGGLTLTLPLGHIPYIPQGSDIETRVTSLGRNAGQIADNPEPLYTVTEPMSYRGASQSWHRLLD